MNMEHRQTLKNALYEASARVPLIVAGPGLQQGVISDELVSLIDLFPTLMDMAGLGHRPAGLDGVSLLPTLLRRRLRPPQLRLQRIPQQLRQHRHRHVAPGPLEIRPLRRLRPPAIQPGRRLRRNPRPSPIPPPHRQGTWTPASNPSSTSTLPTPRPKPTTVKTS